MDLKALRSLLRILREHDLEELEIEEGGRRIRLRRRAAASSAPAAAAPAAEAAPRPAAAEAAPAPTRLRITAPMVGTFYRAPAPGAEPFVKEGDWIEKGTVV
ncbi:MAG TPA: acetyl-CoA carboxylase biotin carboxyl carrier protein, partial [Candidatus Methylomirabilis sp.]